MCACCLIPGVFSPKFLTSGLCPIISVNHCVSPIMRASVVWHLRRSDSALLHILFPWSSLRISYLGPYGSQHIPSVPNPELMLPLLFNECPRLRSPPSTPRSSPASSEKPHPAFSPECLVLCSMQL